MAITNWIVCNIKEPHIALLLCEERNWIKYLNLIPWQFIYLLFLRQSGSGNRCCYDKVGNLMYTNDTHSGSTPGNLTKLKI